MNHAFVHRDFVEIAHREGLKVFVWNIDDRKLLGQYAEMRVDGIASNDPRILKEFFG